MPSRAVVQPLPRSWFENRQRYRRRGPHPSAATTSGPPTDDAWFLLAHPELAIDAPGLDRQAAIPSDLGTSRAELVDAFRATYTNWRLPLTTAAERALSALGDDATTCIVTGQQPGFLGGPIYTLLKALSAIATARWIETHHGTRCIPVFWVAGEDHDIDEVRTARFGAASGGGASDDAVAFSLPHPDDRRPLSSRDVDPATVAVLDAASEHFASLQCGDDAVALVDAYRERSVAGGFAAMLATLLGDRGLVVIDPEQLRPLARPLFRRVIESPGAALGAVQRGAAEVAASGLDPFVRARLPLFRLDDDGRRHHLSPTESGDLRVDGGGPTIERAKLLDELDREPQRFSSGALLRPLIQQSLLPCVATIGGAAEVGYFAQLDALADWLAVRRPAIALRFQATILGGRATRAWRRLGLDLESFSRAREATDLLPPATPSAALRDLDDVRSAFRRTADALCAELPAAQRGLERAIGGIDAALEKLAARASKAHARERDDLWPAAERVWREAFPDGELQERRRGWLELVGRYGTDWLDDLIATIETDPTALEHRLVLIEEH